MFKKLLSNNLLLIALGIIAVVGLIFISFNASQTATNPTSPTSTPLLQPKAAKMPKPVQDKPVSGQIIVKFKPQYTDVQINAHLQQYHANIIKTIEGINQTVVKVPDGQENTIEEQLKTDPYVETVQRDYTTHAFLTPNDPLFAMQYAFDNTGQSVLGSTGTANDDIHVENAWNVTEGNGVKVAILDTGINLNQPDLAGKVVLEKSFVSGVSSVEDGNGHGTHVAGILAADTNNGVGVAGTCPGCQLIIGKILDDSGSGTTSDATDGITWAADNGAKVINMSLGTNDPSTASLYDQAVSYAMSKGAIVVAAAGNDGTNQLNYPAAATGVVAVAATTNTNAKASYSNYGSYVKIAAPGDNILSTGPTHSFQIEPFGYNTSSPYYYLSGTSMATPIVSGVAALVASTSYGTSPQAIINRIYSTADKISGTGTYWTYGLVDAAAAVGTAPTSAPALANGDITPTIFCVGGSGVPPCATIAPNNPGQPSIANSNSNPSVSSAPGVSGTANSISGAISPSIEVSGAPISGTPGGANTGTPGGVCPNLGQLINNLIPSQTGTSSKTHIKCEPSKGGSGNKGGKNGNGGGGNGGGNNGGVNPNNGFLSKLIALIIQFIMQLLQLCGVQPPTTGTPTVSGAPSNSPSQSVSSAPSSGLPSTAISPTSGTGGGSGTAPTTAPVNSSSCTNPVWSSSDAEGTWNAPDGYEVQNDAWNGSHGPQTIYACSGSSFYALSTQPNNGGAVETYPDTGKLFSDAKTVGSYTSITSTFGEAIQQMGEWDAAYDIWTNKWGNELMIWNDTSDHPEIPPSGSQAVTIDGVPYHVWRSGSSYIAFARDTHVQSGSVNITDFFKWLEQEGWMKTSDTLTQIEYGVEVSVSDSSPGVQGQQKFPITNFSLTAN